VFGVQGGGLVWPVVRFQNIYFF